LEPSPSQRDLPAHLSARDGRQLELQAAEEGVERGRRGHTGRRRRPHGVGNVLRLQRVRLARCMQQQSVHGGARIALGTIRGLSLSAKVPLEVCQAQHGHGNLGRVGQKGW